MGRAEKKELVATLRKMNFMMRIPLFIFILGRLNTVFCYDESQKSSTGNHFQFHGILKAQMRLTEERAKFALESAIELHDKYSVPSGWDNTPFDDVLIALPLSPSICHVTNGIGGSDKYYAAPEAIKKAGKAFIVYGAGIAGDPFFENQLAALGADVYGFDCTCPPQASWTEFHFHDWCIGQKTSMQGNLYSKDSKRDENTYIFHSLYETMQLLGHKKVDILKFDIEGFEWMLIENEILNSPDPKSLPDQLLFEVHLEGVTPLAVPPNLVKGKRRHEVNVLVYKLYNLGYRVFNKECNDPTVVCEFSLYRVHH
jgi:hypothetical protein